MVIAGKVFFQRAHQNHRHHADQEQNQHKRVEDGEPVHLTRASPCPRTEASRERGYLVLVLARFQKVTQTVVEGYVGGLPGDGECELDIQQPGFRHKQLDGIIPNSNVIKEKSAVLGGSKRSWISVRFNLC